MTGETQHETALAESISDLLYGIAGWLLVFMGLLSALSVFLHAFNGRVEVVPISILAVSSVLFLVSGVLVNPRFRKRIARRRDVTRFGRASTVDQRVIYASENHEKSCVSCGKPVKNGVERWYREEYVIAGIPIFTASEGRNSYCVDCAMEELNVPEAEKSAENGQRSVDRQQEKSR